MRRHYKYYLFIIPFLFAMTTSQVNVCGTYSINNTEWGSETLVIKKNGGFIKTNGGCVYDMETTGKWEIHKDTLILGALKRKNLRTNREIKVKIDSDTFLIRTDTLFRINSENPNNTYNPEFALIRKKN